MSATVTVLPVRVIRLDANGLPHGHALAKAAVVQEFMDMVNELPDSVYHVGHTDAEWISSNLIRRYLAAVEKEQAR
jgi:hypothetical protein